MCESPLRLRSIISHHRAGLGTTLRSVHLTLRGDLGRNRPKSHGHKPCCPAASPHSARFHRGTTAAATGGPYSVQTTEGLVTVASYLCRIRHSERRRTDSFPVNWAESGPLAHGVHQRVPYSARDEPLGGFLRRMRHRRNGPGADQRSARREGCGEALRRFCTVATSLGRAETLMFLASPLAVRP